MGVPFSVIIIAQSDIGDIECLINWFQKVSLKQLLFEQGTFLESLVSKDNYFLEWTSLFAKPPFLSYH